jgi:hypothetical protein
MQRADELDRHERLGRPHHDGGKPDGGKRGVNTKPGRRACRNQQPVSAPASRHPLGDQRKTRPRRQADRRNGQDEAQR